MTDPLAIGVLNLHPELVAQLALTYNVTAWRRPETSSDLPSPRGVITGSMASACAGSIVISAFADDHELLTATTAPGGVLAVLADDAVHVTTGLHRRSVIETVSREHARQGHRFVAAPILLASAPDRAPAVVVGGPRDLVAMLEPVFAAMSVSIAATCDAPADAALLALAHSAMVGCAIEAIAEAFALVERFDVDATVLRDVMSDALFAGTVYGRLVDSMLAEEVPADGGVNLPTAARGVQLLDAALDAATAARVPLPSVDASRDRLLSAIARGDGERAWTVAAYEQARASGLC